MCLRFLASVLILLTAQLAQAKSLEIHFVDVEGGQATLVVSPSGQTLLVDAGWPGYEGRDASRILAAAREAGVRHIDYMLVTHYHMDHVGGVPELATRIPIGTFLDHGPSVESGKQPDALMASYLSAIGKSPRRAVKPRDKIPIKGVKVTVLTAAGSVIRSPLRGVGAANPLCSGTPRLEDGQGENPRSVGILIEFGKFRMINLGDLTWNKELDLVCPVNRVGKVGVYLTTHHANADSGSAAIVHALSPRAAIMNNGARKGGAPAAWQITQSSPGLEDIWQLHSSVEGGAQHNTPEKFIANLEEKCEGRAIKLAAETNGSFTVTNTRNGFSKRYNPR